MVVSMSNFYLYRTSIGLRCMEKQFKCLSSHKTVVRHLRGTRLGKNLSREEAKYRNLLKTLKDDSVKPVEYLTGKIPIPDDTSPPSDPSKPSKKIDLCKTIEEKITPLKDIRYTRQLEKKYNKSLALLRFFGQKLRSFKTPIILGNDNLPCPIDLTVPSPVQDSYRNQDEFSIGVGLDGNPKTVGFYAGTNLDTTYCFSPEELVIIKESHKELVKDFQNYLKDSSLEPAVKYGDGGYWRSLKIRSNLANELMGIISMHPQQLTKEELLQEADKLREYFLTQKPYYLKSLFLHTGEQQSDGSNLKLNLLLGDTYVLEDFNNMKLQISPNSYFTSNTKALESVYNSLMKVCKVSKSTTILDIFCGTGSLSLTMSPKVHQCIGIDSCPSSIKDAKANAIYNNKHNVQFIEGNTDFLINEILNKDFYEDIIAVVNPARCELTKTAVQSLRMCKHLKKIIYITTKPKSAIDNYIRLSQPSGGRSYLGKPFIPIFAIPVDLFPQTDHFGLIVMFQRL